jgi:Cu(I)/Ag(I) efflux system membrane protein CusA/SilA
MINSIIKYALNNRTLIIMIALGLLIYGGWTLNKLPIDVFPNLNRPVVTVMTEAHGLAPDEVETLVTIPLESVLNGISKVERIRSSSGIGISIIYVEFEWDTDIYRNRQLITERLQLVSNRLPEGMTPMMAPITSIMGEIQFVGLISESDQYSLMDLREIADWYVKPQLMAIPGVSQIIAMGGESKQYQILVSSEKLQFYGITVDELKSSLKEISANTTGGFIDLGKKEFLIRPLGRVNSLEDIENTYLATHLGKSVLIKDIAEIKIGSEVKRGEASINGKKSVVLTIKKQPDANTIELTKKIEEELKGLQESLPQGIKIETDLFKQANFIQNSIDNVEEALIDGAIMVAIILFLFLMNFRTTTITLLAIPLSLVLTAIIFKIFGLGINTMTLGGIAIAIGELVDDAIVDVENVFRRLKQNKLLDKPKPVLKVIYQASKEIRNSIVFSTMIVVLVFVPLFALSGIEGRLFTPLGIAYIISLLASLLVSLTVTPVLCYYFLPQSQAVEKKDSFIVQKIKKIVESILQKTINHPYLILSGCMILLIGALALFPLMGKNFLPKFNEETATIGVSLSPGISLKESNEMGRKIEEAILSIPEVKSTVRRTGRAKGDEHAVGVHWNEIDVDFHKNSKRKKEEVLNDMRKKIHSVGDLHVNIGQPISHRLDHLLSGVRAEIAIKVFGNDLSQLRLTAGEIYLLLNEIEGLVDVQVEPVVPIPQLKIDINRDQTSKARLNPGHLAYHLESLLNGEVVGQFLEDQQYYDIFMRLDEKSRNSPENIEKIFVQTLPTGEKISLNEVANVYQGYGANEIKRENMLRRMVISANADGRDLNSLIKEIRSKIDQEIITPVGCFIQYDGQFKSQQEASKLIFFLGALSLLGILMLLYLHFRSVTLSLQIMINIPLALIGSMIAIYLTERILSIATLIAFITLCGIASRNGIMMISHYLHLVKHENENFDTKMIIRGTLERLIPVLMTAFTAVLALLPIALSKGEPGKEILYPVAVVIIGGLITSTLLDIIVTPAIFKRFGKKPVEKYLSSKINQTLEKG